MIGDLYIVSTPIGNLSDISNRALEILSEVNLIAVEDTRISKKILNKYNINNKMIVYKMILNLTISVRFPTNVELIRLDLLNTFFSTSFILLPANIPQTWVFLPNEIISG